MQQTERQQSELQRESDKIPRVTVFSPQTLATLKQLEQRLQADFSENLPMYQDLLNALASVDPFVERFMDVRDRLRGVTGIGLCNTAASIMTKTLRKLMPAHHNRISTKIAVPLTPENRKRYTFHAVSTLNFSDVEDLYGKTDPEYTMFLDFAPLDQTKTYDFDFMQESHNYGFKPVYDVSEVEEDPENNYKSMLEGLRQMKGNLNPYQFIQLLHSLDPLND